MTPNPALLMRQVAELTQSEAASLIGVSSRTWRNWESGACPMPAAKAHAFRDAVLRLDLTSKTPQTPTTRSAGGLTPAALAAESALLDRPRVEVPWETDGDLFGQARVEPLRTAPFGAALLTTNEPTEGGFEPIAGDDVGDDELADLLGQMRQARSAAEV